MNLNKWDFIVWMLEKENENGNPLYDHQEIAGRMKWLKLNDLSEAIYKHPDIDFLWEIYHYLYDTRQWTAAQQKAYETMIQEADYSYQEEYRQAIEPFWEKRQAQEAESRKQQRKKLEELLTMGSRGHEPDRPTR
jgi:hypothetical protein